MEIHDSRPVDYRWHIMMMMMNAMTPTHFFLIVTEAGWGGDLQFG